MTHEQFKEELTNYAKEKENSMGDLLVQVEKLNMEKLLYLQHYIAQTIVFFNVNRNLNLKKAAEDVKEPV